MKGTMIIKEILGLRTGKEAFPVNWGGQKGPPRLSGAAFLTQTRRNGLFLGFLFRGNEATLPP